MYKSKRIKLNLLQEDISEFSQLADYDIAVLVDFSIFASVKCYLLFPTQNHPESFYMVISC